MSAEQYTIDNPDFDMPGPRAPGPGANKVAETSETSRPHPSQPVDPTPAPAVAGEGLLQAYEPPKDPSPDDEVDRLLPDPDKPVTLDDGTLVQIKPLRLREFLAMLKIVTRGAAIAMGQIRLDARDEDFMQSMIAMFLFAIPEAEEEAIDFIRIMVEPAKAYGDSDEERAQRAQDQDKLDVYLNSPSLDDTFTVIENIIHREGSDLRRLGKRLTSALAFAQKTGQSSSTEPAPQ